MSKHVSLVIRGVLGWTICGATVGVGRQMVSMDATLVIHALVAPLAFGLLTWNYFHRYPKSSAGGTALSMLGIVAALDALVVAPFFERSYAMFRSVIGTWVPFASILVSSYLAGRAAGARTGTGRSREHGAAEQAHAPDGRGS